MSTNIEDALLTADDAFKKSGYIQIDYTINEDAFVYDAVQKFAAFNIGCLVTVNNGAFVIMEAPGTLPV